MVSLHNDVENHLNVVEVRSARDSSRFLIGAVFAQGEEGISLCDQEFFDNHISGTGIAYVIRSLPSPWGPLCQKSLLESAAMRARPHRVLEFGNVVQGMIESGEINPCDENFGQFVHRLCRYAANIYSRQDDPKLSETQRSLLDVSKLLRETIDIFSAPDHQTHFPIPSLSKLGRRMEIVLRQMSQAGILKKSRDTTVLKWCRKNVLRTRQRYIDKNGRPALPDVVEVALADVKVIAVVFNILLDEIADDVQDIEKFEVFRTIPFAEDGSLSLVDDERRKTLGLKVPWVWHGYLNLTIDAWNAVYSGLETIVGPRMFNELEPQLRSDYNEVIAAMKYALELNSSPTVELISLPAGGEILAYNMNMMAFETFDRMALGRYNPTVSAQIEPQSYAYTLLRQAVAMLQYNGQIGNSTTTLDAELDENCIANIAVIHAFGEERPRELATIFYARRDALRRGDLASYNRLGDKLKALVKSADSRSYCLKEWENHRQAALKILEETELSGVIDVQETINSHDMLLATSWMFRGDI